MENPYPQGNYIGNAKVPPQNIDAEEALLGCAISSKDARENLVSLEEEDFYQEKNGKIYSTLKQMMANGESIDILSVSDNLSKQGLLTAVGGVGYITYLEDKSFNLANVDEYIAMIKEKSKLRKLLNFTEKMQTAIYSGQTSADDLINLMAQEVVNSRDDMSNKDLVPIQDVLSLTIKELRKVDSDELSIDSGFPGLNDMLGNLRRQTLNIIAARPAMGKSALALNVALNVALKGKVVVIFSLEMSQSEVGLRLLSSASGVPSKSISENMHNPGKNNQQILDATQALVSTNVYIDDSASTSPADIRAKSQRLKAQIDRLDLIVIDYLQLMGSDGYAQNRQQEISEISRALKIMARDLDVPVIALSQLSRSVEMRENKRPMLSDLRESGAIEQDADAVMFLYRESYYESEGIPAVPEESELIVSKNRQGATGTIKLNWFADITTFREKEFIPYEAPPETGFSSSNTSAEDLPF